MLYFIFSTAFGAFTVLGLYHLIGFSKKNKDRSLIFFGIMMVLLALYSLVNNPFILGLLQENLHKGFFCPENCFRINVILADILAPVCLAYAGSLFPEEFSARIIKWSVIAVFLSSLTAVILPHINGIVWEDCVNETLVNIIILYIFYGFLKAIARKREDALIVMIGLMPGIVSGIYINILKHNPYEVEYLKPAILITGTLASVFLQAIILADRNVRACIRLEESARELSETNQAFMRFVPHTMLSLMEKNDITSVNLGDHSRHEMTVMFVDIRGFTSISEKMNPEDNFVFLNTIMNQIAPVIRENNGLVDKYVGDGIMALFPGDAENSLSAAVEIRSVLAGYNQKRSANRLPEVNIGIGIHTGDLMIGTIGEPERMDCTVISDAVNTAARLERATKFYGCTVIVSETVMQHIEKPEKYQFRMLGSIRPKGKREPVVIMEICNGDPEEVILLKQKTMNTFQEGIKMYQQGRFSEAHEKFGEVLKINSEDMVVFFYFSRSLYFLINGIPIDWDGIEDIDVK